MLYNYLEISASVSLAISNSSLVGTTHTSTLESEYMNKKSGFLGVSGVSSDNRDISGAAAHGDKRAKLVSEILT